MTPVTPVGELHVRRAAPDEVSAVVALAGEALGWDPNRPNEAFFRWKHLDNSFGTSPMWVAELDGRLVGVRTFLRWRFRRPDGTTFAAVRAVDTATHPDAQGRGIFTALTTQALDELRADGVEAVFNTPNDQSRPGYLKMGWTALGRVPIVVRAAGPGALARLARARVPAEKWSEAVDTGRPAPEVLADTGAVADLLRTAPSHGIGTDRSPEHLAWRYGLAPLHYRVLTVARDAGDGLVVFRVRRRGAAREATICELLVPGDDPTRTRRLLADVRRRTGADYLVWAGRRLPATAGFAPLPNQGPILTWRTVGDAPAPVLDDLDLALGDVELF